MNKQAFFLIFLVISLSNNAMEPIQPTPQYPTPMGFDTSHYYDFLKCYFDGKPSEKAIHTYMNFCVRDKMWGLYKNFLENGGTRVVDMLDRPTTSAPEDFQRAKEKLTGLKSELDKTILLMEELEDGKSPALEKLKKKKNKTKKAKINGHAGRCDTMK